MRNKTLIILYVCIFFVGCKSKRQKEIEYFLTKNDYKFWVHYQYISEFDFLSKKERCYYKNGVYERCYLNEEEKIRFLYGNPFGSDVIPIHKDYQWKLQNDSIIEFNGERNKIILINDSIFKYVNILTKDTFVEFKSQYQEIEIKK